MFHFDLFLLVLLLNVAAVYRYEVHKNETLLADMKKAKQVLESLIKQHKEESKDG